MREQTCGYRWSHDATGDLDVQRRPDPRRGEQERVAGSAAGRGATPAPAIRTRRQATTPGGVHVVRADGSGRFTKNTISRATWWAIGTKTGGEVVSADQF